VVLLVRSGLCVLVAGLGLGTAITAATATAATTAATTAAAAFAIALVVAFHVVASRRLVGNGRGDRSGGLGGRCGTDRHRRGGSLDHRRRRGDVLDFRLGLGGRLGRGLLLPGLARRTRLPGLL